MTSSTPTPLPITLDLSKPVQTNGGLKVRIYATDGGDGFPLHGAMFLNDRWQLFAWDKDGFLPSGNGNYRLINVPPPKVPFRRELWCNVYQDDGITAHDSKERADSKASSIACRIACVRVVVEGHEGDGLNDPPTRKVLTRAEAEDNQ